MNTYHVHTKWSDGKGEFTDYIKAAIDYGLEEIGFSDHYTLMPDRSPVWWSMPPDKIDNYVREILSLQKDYSNKLTIKLGLEVDYFPETCSELKELLKNYPFDYIIGSVHSVDEFPVDHNRDLWENLSKNERNDIIKKYWNRIGQMAESRFCDIAGHMELTKKFGFYPDIDISGDISNALDSIAKSGMAFEVNTSGYFKVCRDTYPCRNIIKECFNRHIPVLITADAHRPPDITRNFSEAKEILREIGYKEFVCYSGRKRLSRLF